MDFWQPDFVFKHHHIDYQIKRQKGPACSIIAKENLDQLPEWFAIKSAREDFIHGVANCTFLVAQKEDKNIGFVSYKEHFPGSFEIYVMGVLKEYHRKGIGRDLLAVGEMILKKQGGKFLQVKTLSDSHPDYYYGSTRQFYFEQGFVPVEEINALWGEQNPCLLLIKNI